MITEENGVFHIRTETCSYLFKINAYGLAEHLHFGAPVKTRDAGALSCRPGPGSWRYPLHQGECWHPSPDRGGS